MSGFERILVGLDGSDRAGDAVALAQRLLEPGRGALVLAHVDAGRVLHGLRRHHPGRDAEQALAAGRALVGAETPVSELVRASASVARGLTELAEEQRVDLLVVGAHHGGPEGRTCAGRTAMRLLQGAPCAVAIAAAGRRDAGAFHHVGIAYDGSPESEAALATAYALAARDGAAVSLYLALSLAGPSIVAGIAFAQAAVSVAEAEHAALLSRLRAQELLDAAAEAAPAGLNPRTVLVHGEPAREIARAADGIVDVLFAGSRGYGPMQRALAGSVSEGLLRGSAQPVVMTARGGAGR